MANALKGEAKLGDYTLAFNFGAFCELEQMTGKKTQQLLEDMAEGLSFSELREFVWAGLRQHHSEVDMTGVTALLNEHGYKAAGQAVGAAVASGLEDPKAKGKNPPKAAA